MELPWDDAVDLIRSASDVTLFAHVNPDADALGSALALALVLQRRGATVRVSFAEPADVPVSLRGLDSAGLIVPPAQVPAAPPLLIALDAGSLGRLGSLRDRVAKAGATLVIDHHASNTHYGTMHLVDEHAEATAVLVLDLIDRLGAELDEPVARCLYAGLVTDTSSFRRAKPTTLRAAARLLDAGVDADALTRELMGTHPFSWLPMLGAVLNRARLVPTAAGGLGLVYAVVREADRDGLGLDDVESVVDIVRTAKEAEVAVVLKELAPLRWSVSMRAVSRVDVSQVAQTLGGGGHRLASGFTTQGTEDEVLAAIVAALD